MTDGNASLNTEITYDALKLASYYPDVTLLTLSTPQGDRSLPYQVRFEYPDDSELENTWGFAEFLERAYRTPKELQAHADTIALRHPPKISKEGDAGGVCPRVAAFHVGAAGIPHWKLEKATYADQVATNMYPDALLIPPPAVGPNAMTAHTVREWDQLQAGLINALTTFESSRLANTVGVAVGITAKNANGQEVVLWRQRSKRVRLYEGMAHLPMSFALNVERDRVWRGTYSWRELIVTDYNAERAEELGVEQHFFSRLIALAFCRDLPRAGKPQFFLEKRSFLSFEELRSRVIPTSPEFIGELSAFALDEAPPEDASPELLAYVALKRRQRERRGAV